ncbi:helix-turn-helix transcriptional regulator [Frankia sp. CiP3]|uniref:helix-turn-helix transcriptional regulator n=1 Tax=Frankia sp. CiP3 TaxID=2880971 RepID=UPI001EF48DA4|nr:helix-turn-helix transcriptional regulator [Frankia sp. CiP3]
MIVPRKYRQVLDFAQELYRHHPAEIDYGVIAQTIQNVLECPVCTFSEVGLSEAGALGLGWPETQVDSSEITTITLRNMHRHPLIRRYVNTSDRRPLAVTDLVPLLRWKSSAAGSDIHAALDFYDHIAIPMESPRGTMRSFALGRSDGGPFTGQERQLVLALHPLLAAMDDKARQLRQQTPASLTPREEQILQMVRTGLTSRRIGARLRLSPRTVEKHLQSAYSKLGVTNRIDAINAFITDAATSGASSPLHPTCRDHDSQHTGDDGLDTERGATAP